MAIPNFSTLPTPTNPAAQAAKDQQFRREIQNWSASALETKLRGLTALMKTQEGEERATTIRRMGDVNRLLQQRKANPTIKTTHMSSPGTTPSTSRWMPGAWTGD